MAGPLEGVRIVELAGIGPGPYAAMLLADAGADVLRLERAAPGSDPEGVHWDLLNRSRRSVGIDLKAEGAVALVLDLVAEADALVEGFRPGVAERLGLGPDDCLAVNERIVYGRMTGWGQEGPMAARAGHDINYIALSGALWAIGREGERPVPPLNLVGDFGGGSMFLAFGVVSAILNARATGRGQVVDAAMVDGAASLMTMGYSFLNAGLNREERGVNMLDTGAHFYEVYETKDHGYFSVGAIEPQFYAELLDGMGLADRDDLPRQMDRERWAEMKELFASIFATKTRDEWTEIFIHRDACAVPVLSPTEAAADPHMAARGTFAKPGGVLQPGPAPRFSRTPSEISGPPRNPGADTAAALLDWGVDAERVSALQASGAIS